MGRTDRDSREEEQKNRGKWGGLITTRNNRVCIQVGVFLGAGVHLRKQLAQAGSCKNGITVRYKLHQHPPLTFSTKCCNGRHKDLVQ